MRVFTASTTSGVAHLPTFAWMHRNICVWKRVMREPGIIWRSITLTRRNSAQSRTPVCALAILHIISCSFSYRCSLKRCLRRGSTWPASWRWPQPRTSPGIPTASPWLRRRVRPSSKGRAARRPGGGRTFSRCTREIRLVYLIPILYLCTVHYINYL